MGFGFVIKCNICGMESEYFLGTGALYWSLDTILQQKVLRKNKRIKIWNILQYTEPDFVDFQHKLYGCPSCETLHERFYINISENDHVIYETWFRCSICRSKLLPVKGEISSYRCKLCRKRSLMVIGHFVWD